MAVALWVFTPTCPLEHSTLTPRRDTTRDTRIRLAGGRSRLQERPFAWLLDSLASTVTWIVPREAIERWGDLRRPEACIGTGPWMLERYDPNVRCTFVRNPEYFVPGLPY